MLKLKHLLLVSAVICAPAFASKLIISETLKVLEINGVEYSGGFLAKNTEFDIAQGEQRLLLKYEEFFEEDDENFATIRSKPFLFSFTAQDNQIYTVSTPTLDSEQEGKVFAKQPQVVITNKLDQVVAANVAMLTATSVTQIPVVASPVTTRVSAPQTAPTTNTFVSEVKNTKQPAAKIPAQPAALSMLNFWWQQATEAEKQQFLSSLKNK